MGRTFAIYTGKSRKSPLWSRQELTWPELRDKLTAFTVTGETLDEYLMMSREEQTQVKDVGGFVGGTLRDGIRKKANLESRSIITLDFDGFTPGQLAGLREQLPGVSWCVYSTHKHRPTEWRVRVVIPMSRDTDPDEYVAVSRRVAQMIGFNGIDRTTFEPCRLMFWPSRPVDAEYLSETHEAGAFLKPDAILATYDDWRDPAQWPRTPDEQNLFDLGSVPSNDPRKLEIWMQYVGKSTGKAARDGSGMEDPVDKDGYVGAFCRCYGIAEAIQTFLPDRYTLYRPGRYTYAGASTVGGAVVYNDKWLYSNHATDPAGGRELNAYDLVRVHLYGSRDAGSKAASVSGLPSSACMAELCRRDARIRKELNARSLDKAREAFNGIELPDEGDSDDDEWLEIETTLLDKKGKFKVKSGNIRKVLMYHPHLRGRLRFNEFAHHMEIRGEVPWRRASDYEFTDRDGAALRGWLDDVYDISAREKTEDAISQLAGYVRYHPVRDYFDSLKWDGTRRLGRLLPDLLGADDTELTRELSMLPFIGAVARIYEPGKKFDICLTLYGPEGCGKSTLCRAMAGEWFNDNLQGIGTKEAKGDLRGVLIAELGEMSAVKRADVDSVKNFISAQEDVFRPAYGRHTVCERRQCVFIATTNDEYCLRGFGSNRRFPVVEVDPQRRRVGPKTGTEYIVSYLTENRDQLWAEAVSEYRAGHRLYLDARLEEEARTRNARHSLEVNDANFELVDFYLDREIPDNWGYFNAQQRRTWLASGRCDGMSVDLVPRRQVCISELMFECLDMRPGSKDYTSMARRVAQHIDRNHPEWRRTHHVPTDKAYGRGRGWVRDAAATPEDDNDII